MVTLFRKQYVDPTNPGLGFTETDYFIDDEVVREEHGQAPFSGFFKKIGKTTLEGGCPSKTHHMEIPPPGPGAGG